MTQELWVSIPITGQAPRGVGHWTVGLRLPRAIPPGADDAHPGAAAGALLRGRVGMERWQNEHSLTDHRENTTEKQPQGPASQGKNQGPRHQSTGQRRRRRQSWKTTHRNKGENFRICRRHKTCRTEEVDPMQPWRSPEKAMPRRTVTFRKLRSKRTLEAPWAGGGGGAEWRVETTGTTCQRLRDLGAGRNDKIVSSPQRKAMSTQNPRTRENTIKKDGRCDKLR